MPAFEALDSGCFFRPFGAGIEPDPFPRLAPWAEFFHRSAAGSLAHEPGREIGASFDCKLIEMNCRFVCLVVAGCLIAIAPAQQKTNSIPASKQSTADTTYQDSIFGFRYRLPYGWVDRTKEMQETDQNGKGQVLLAVFERPPQATGVTVNSAVVIAAEPVEAYPGLKKAEDYLEPLTELTTAKGFKAVDDPSEVMVGAQRLVRADFSKAITDKITMQQSTLVVLKKGQIISFTFIGESTDGVERLMEGLDFPAAKALPK